MCPTGTVLGADNLNRAKLGWNSLTISLTKSTLVVANEDWIVQMEDFAVYTSLFSTKFTNSLYNQPSGLNNLIHRLVLQETAAWWQICF